MLPFRLWTRIGEILVSPTRGESAGRFQSSRSAAGMFRDEAGVEAVRVYAVERR